MGSLYDINYKIESLCLSKSSKSKCIDMKVNVKLSEIIEEYKHFDSYIKLKNSKNSKNEKQLKIEYVFDELNTYLNNIDINININIINNIAEFIIINFKDDTTHLINIENDIYKYIFTNLQEYYDLIMNKLLLHYFEETNSINYYKEYEYKFILILYSYYYYINIILIYIYDIKKYDIETIATLIKKNLFLIDLFKSIDDDHLKYIFKSIKYDDKINNDMKKDLFINVISNFNINVLLLDKKVNIFSIEDIIISINNNIKILNAKDNKYINIIIDYLSRFYEIYDTEKNYDDLYITIPQ